MPANTTEDDVKDSLVVGETSHGLQIRGTLLKVTRFLVVFETYSPVIVLRLSEVLSNLRIVINDETVYSGRAVISNLVNAGTVLVCEAKLDESGLNLALLTSNWKADSTLAERFDGFVGQWQRFYRVAPEFKTVMADLQSFLIELRLWLDQMELEIRSSPSADRTQLERKAVDELAGPIIRSIDTFIDRFEAIAAGLETDLVPAHRAYLRRQLHPLVLCSPFAYRTFHKPLGYAGDYEMVDMMVRSPYEGSSLFAKIINVWLIGQAPAEAHRNRVAFLTRKLVEETARAAGRDGTARVFNLGCGPATEVQRFLQEQFLADRVRLTLVDFNEETLQYLRRRLEEVKTRCHRSTPVQLLRKSVHQMLKESGRPVARTPENLFDYVYCAGLFDYLSNPVCKRLMNLLYEMLAPGGLLVATNVSDALNRSRPFRYSMEYILDWHLIYRDGRGVAALAPDAAPRDNIRVVTETTGVNVFIEVRKPDHG